MAANPGSSSRFNVGEKKPRVLVVEDDLLMSLVLKTLLTYRFGVETYEAENGQEAVDFLLHGTHFDLILMDLEMPVMDGIQAVRMLRSKGVTSYIVGNSATSSRDKIKEFMSSGLDGFLKKPIQMEKLAPVIHLLT